MGNYLIFGASRGLGAAFSLGLPDRGDRAWLVSRAQPVLASTDGVERIWVQADLADPAAARATLTQAMAGQPLDVVIYNAGIWEARAFEADYDFEQSAPETHDAILAVNLVAAIHCLQALLPNVRAAAAGKIILIGSTSGLENSGAPEVAYNASKFGLRGLAHGLREIVRRDGIAVTVINPGTLSGQPYDPRAPGRRDAIPFSDLVALVRCLISLSPAACVKEIDLPAMNDRTA